MTDEAYAAMQSRVELVSRLLISFDVEELNEFIARAEQSIGIAPILHPTEFQRGAHKLELIIACADALRQARHSIVKAADL